MHAAEKGGPADGPADEQDSGRKRMRRILIEPMLEKGLVRPRSMKAGTFDVLQVRIADRLVWITDEIADVLVDMAAREAPGLDHNEFPTEERINGWARTLAAAMGIAPPIDLPKKVTSYLASAAGRDAWARNPHEAMALYRFLIDKPGVPGTEWARNQVRDFEEEYDRRSRDIERKVDAGTATPDDYRWLDHYHDRRDLVRTLVGAQSNIGVA